MRPISGFGGGPVGAQLIREYATGKSQQQPRDHLLLGLVVEPDDEYAAPRFQMLHQASVLSRQDRRRRVAGRLVPPARYCTGLCDNDLGPSPVNAEPGRVDALDKNPDRQVRDRVVRESARFARDDKAAARGNELMQPKLK